MADQPPEELHLRHERDLDYREISADGTLHKIVGDHLVITFYIEDSRITAEVLKRDGQDSYRSAAMEEEKQALCMLPVRVPTNHVLELAASVADPLFCPRDPTTSPPFG